MDDAVVSGWCGRWYPEVVGVQGRVHRAGGYTGWEGVPVPGLP